ncbi:hypothetical protein RLDS_06980 [Sphingobium lactosutens DS20]|jgi:hypothetical protein|uniref:Uncharacterized protein n=1 Tax=Sphingobium lactosutens DS20 TaxID=1331060 RepID=T0J3K5_9SPHN|nr:hypothetical protein RLDS_06980 [Sphingobium lactosutens DS20]
MIDSVAQLRWRGIVRLSERRPLIDVDEDFHEYPCFSMKYDFLRLNHDVLYMI